MLVMALACWAYCIAAALLRVRSIIVEREAHTAWVQDLARSA
jgi:heme exporter protein C